MRIRASSSAMTTRRTVGGGARGRQAAVTAARLVGYGFLAVGPGSPTAEAMVSNTIQCEFESHPGHHLVVGGRWHRDCMYDARRRARRPGARRRRREPERHQPGDGIARSTIRSWSRCPAPVSRSAPLQALACCGADYAALLGFYLGDGCVSTFRHRRRSGSRATPRWPGSSPTSPACLARPPGWGVFHVRRPEPWSSRATGSTGRASSRSTARVASTTGAIVLAEWQGEIVTAFPADFLRGLFASPAGPGWPGPAERRGRLRRVGVDRSAATNGASRREIPGFRTSMPAPSR